MTINYNTLVTNSNFDKEIINFENALSSASFISIDTEFSGVGFHKSLKLNNVQERYSFIAKLVKSRSLLQLGVAIFIDSNDNIKTAEAAANISSNEIKNENNKRTLNQEDSSNTTTTATSLASPIIYQVRMFTFLCLNQSEFQVFPTSMTFLAQHGLDFNKLFMDGIPFTPRKHSDLPANCKQRKIIDLLSAHQLPLVIHNGFFDLLFLFQSFISDLPEQLNVFITKLTKYFPKIYDTKFISEYKLGENRSFLQYLFMKYERINYQRYISNQSYIICDQVLGFNQNKISEPLVNVQFSKSKPYDGTKICSDFANHGYCKNGINCKLSHNINIILDEEEKRKSQKPTTSNNNNSPILKKQKQENTATTGTILGAPITPKSDTDDDNSITIQNIKDDTLAESTIDEDSVIIDNNNNNVNNETLDTPDETTTTTTNTTSAPQEIHSAGYDSAMTGFIFAYYQNLLPKMNDIDNRIYLTGKNVPLLLKKSNYA